jgi:hypothetical protein
MNVGDQLGLDEGSALLERARQRWSTWVASDDLLAVVEDFDELRDWLATADRGAADEVLLALAMLAAPDGGDDVVAAAALAKCLLPGACRLAGWLASQRRQVLPGGVESATELVASQLWIEVRSFPWRRGRKVAANILLNTRAGVLRECGDFTQVARTNQTWVHTELVEAFMSGDRGADIDVESRRTGERHRAAVGWRPCLLVDPNPGPGEQHSPLEELREVLGWACEQDVITTEDRFLLLCLVEEASQAEVARVVANRKRTHRVTRDGGRGGLLANDVAVRVAPRVGASEATVRRRASKCVRALAAAVPARFGDDD